MEQKILKLFRKACADYHLLNDGDRILVALSGGKDSLALVRLLAQQARIFRPQIHVEAAHVIMDNIPYETERSYIQQFCENEGVKLYILHSYFDESTDPRKTRCFLCAWNRRKTLFEFAVENSFNKIALGHHMDDFLVTALMNVTFEGSFSSMQPEMNMEHYPLSIIRPLCLVHESMIKNVAETEGFQKQKAFCPYEHETQRTNMSNVLAELERLNPEARYSLWHAITKTWDGSEKVKR